MTTTTLYRYRRSPYLVVTWDDTDLTLLACDTLRRFRVDHRLLALISGVSQWSGSEALTVDGTPIAEEELERLVDQGILQRSDEDSGSETPSYWDPFDLAVQCRSRTGGFRESAVRARGDTAPPASKPRPHGASTALPAAADLPAGLAEVLRDRRTVRSYGSSPLGLHDLSAVLHHAARITDESSHPFLGEHVQRPFASAGGRSELEIYVVANAVEGLAPGPYYHDSRAHDLIQLSDAGDVGRERLNRRIHGATGGMLSSDPPVIVLITAVFARVMWKYEGIGLALIYKNVGCLTQNLYLVATALGLAPCAVGAGDEATNATWLGLDPLVESQVGCFLLGPRA